MTCYESCQSQMRHQRQSKAAVGKVVHRERRDAEGPSVKDLQAKSGQLAMENDFLAGALGRIDDASAK